MAGVNYMGGKGRTAKDRLKNKNAVKTKEHFAKSHLSARNLNPFLSRGSTNAGASRPTFDFQHARLAGAKAPSVAASRSTNEKPEPSPTKVSGVDSTPKSKKRKTPPSKAMRQLEDAEPISYAYKRMKVLELSDLAGLGKLGAAVSPKTLSPEDAKQTSPAAPFPMALSQENAASDYAPSIEEDTADTLMKGDSRFHPDDSPSNLPLLVRRPFSYETPRRPSAKQIPKPINQPIPLSYSSSSSPWPASLGHRGVAASERSASFDPLSLDTTFDASAPKDDENCVNEADPLKALCIKDPWTCLATQMNIKLSPPRQDEPFLPCDEYLSERLPPSERSGADFYAALWARQYPPNPTNAKYDEDTVVHVPTGGRNLYDYLSPDDLAPPSQDWSICVDHSNGLDVDYSSTEMNFDSETPQDRKAYGSYDYKESSDSSQLGKDDMGTLLLEELCEIDEDPEADMEDADQVGFAKGTHRSSLLERTSPVEENWRPDIFALPKRLEIQSSLVPSSSILSFDPTPATASSGAKSTQPKYEVAVPLRQFDQPGSITSSCASVLPDALPSPSRDDDPFDFLKGLDDKVVSQDVHFNIDDILDGKLCEEVPRNVAPNPFEQLTTTDVAMPGVRLLEGDLTITPGTRSRVRFLSPFRSSEERDLSSSIFREDLKVPHRASTRITSPNNGRDPSLPQAEASKAGVTEIPPTQFPAVTSGAALTSANGRLMGPSLFDDSNSEGSDDEY